MSDLRLEGCRTEPLGSYLKALGVLRLVAEQSDPDARGWWEGDTFVLRTALDRDALVRFCVDEYIPTPLVAPWNSGSGFRRKGKRPAAERVVEEIESSSADRLQPYRATIAEASKVVDECEQRGWRSENQNEFWAKKKKHLVVELCRARLPEAALPWLDAAVVLAEEPEFLVPLLGTGGNLGSRELSVSFMECVIQVLRVGGTGGQQKQDANHALLEAALLGGPEAPGIKKLGTQLRLSGNGPLGVITGWG